MKLLQDAARRRTPANIKIKHDLIFINKCNLFWIIFCLTILTLLEAQTRTFEIAYYLSVLNNIMVARFTQLTFSSANVENAKAVYNAEIAPVIRSFSGNVQVILLAPENASEEFISFSLWEQESDLKAFESSAAYKPVMQKIKDLAEKAVPKYYHIETIL